MEPKISPDDSRSNRDLESFGDPSDCDTNQMATKSPEFTKLCSERALSYDSKSDGASSPLLEIPEEKKNGTLNRCLEVIPRKIVDLWLPTGNRDNQTQTEVDALTQAEAAVLPIECRYTSLSKSAEPYVTGSTLFAFDETMYKEYKLFDLDSLRSQKLHEGKLKIEYKRENQGQIERIEQFSPGIAKPTDVSPYDDSSYNPSLPCALPYDSPYGPSPYYDLPYVSPSESPYDNFPYGPSPNDASPFDDAHYYPSSYETSPSDASPYAFSRASSVGITPVTTPASLSTDSAEETKPHPPGDTSPSDKISLVTVTRDWHEKPYNKFTNPSSTFYLDDVSDYDSENDERIKFFAPGSKLRKKSRIRKAEPSYVKKLRSPKHVVSEGKILTPGFYADLRKQHNLNTGSYRVSNGKIPNIGPEFREVKLAESPHPLKKMYARYPRSDEIPLLERIYISIGLMLH